MNCGRAEPSQKNEVCSGTGTPNDERFGTLGGRQDKCGGKKKGIKDAPLGCLDRTRHGRPDSQRFSMQSGALN
jgi:hypothetical protein